MNAKKRKEYSDDPPHFSIESAPFVFPSALSLVSSRCYVSRQRDNSLKPHKVIPLYFFEGLKNVVAAGS